MDSEEESKGGSGGGSVGQNPSSRRAGVAEYGWLSSRHSFTFGSYHDPEHIGFRALRGANDDRVKPGRGFATHPHRDMEILSFVVEDELEHRDSLGNGSVVSTV